MKDLAKEIIKDSFTKQQALAKLSQWREVVQEHLFGKADLSPVDGKVLGGLDEDNFEKTFKQVQEKLEKMEILVVYTAVELPEKVVSSLGKRARTVLGTEMFLDFKVDPQIIGGAALAWRGEYKDYSLRARFEEKKKELDEIYSKLLK